MENLRRLALMLLVCLLLAGVAAAATHDLLLQPAESVTVSCAGPYYAVATASGGAVVVSCAPIPVYPPLAGYVVYLPGVMRAD